MTCNQSDCVISVTTDEERTLHHSQTYSFVCCDRSIKTCILEVLDVNTKNSFTCKLTCDAEGFLPGCFLNNDVIPGSF